MIAQGMLGTLIKYQSFKEEDWPRLSSEKLGIVRHVLSPSTAQSQDVASPRKVTHNPRPTVCAQLIHYLVYILGNLLRLQLHRFLLYLYRAPQIQGPTSHPAREADEYNTRNRVEVVRLTYSPSQASEARVALCYRREIQRPVGPSPPSYKRSRRVW